MPIPPIETLAFLPLAAALVLRLSPGRGWLDWRPWAVLALLLAVGLRIVDPGGLAVLLAPALVLVLRERTTTRALRCAWNALLVLWCLALAAHQLPGIHNPLLFSGALSPRSVEYRLYWNLDKAFAGLFLLALWERRERPSGERRFLWLAGGGLLMSMGLALGSGLTAFEPRWSSLFLLWAPANLLLVALPEEALFRLVLQDRLEACFSGRTWASAAAIAASSLLFGLAHLLGGWRYVAAATAAGLGYGCAFRYRRNPWHPVLAHFGFNALHFLFSVYPWLR